MIIVLLAFFQSICLFCQRLILHIHDRWINPKNTRIQQEVAETPAALRQQLLQNIQNKPTEKRPRRRLSTECRFCLALPQGYCRHHLHLQELQLQKQQQRRYWIPFNETDPLQEYRNCRKINREIRRHLKNRESQHPSASYYHISTQLHSQQYDINTTPSPSYSNYDSNENIYEEIDQQSVDSGLASSPSSLQETTYCFQHNLENTKTLSSLRSSFGSSRSHSRISTTYL